MTSGRTSINVGICGLGTVGGGTFALLKGKQDEITRRLGETLRVVHVASRRMTPGFDTDGVKFSDDVMAVAHDPEVDVLVETIGGFDAALELVMEAIDHGKHVVTANKALIAVHGNEIFARAKAKGVVVAFESAVAGGIPIIKALREGLAANSINWLAGIINGTGNYILTEMGKGHRGFNEVLAEAQALGYAEADPTFDVEGIDAAHKLTILASIAFGISLQFDKVYTEGISRITIEDVKYASELGYRIKHLGIAHISDRGVELRVHPTLVSKKKLIANVNGVMNAVLVKGDSVGSTLYYGAGAGAEATASSVVADIIDIARSTVNTVAGGRAFMPSLAFNELRSDIEILPIEEIESAYYLRIPALDKLGVMAKISSLLQDFRINIEAVIQKEPTSNHVPIVILTDRVIEKHVNAAITAIEELAEVSGKVIRIRMEELDGEENQ
ncbi:MAG: homoserine dehydrogenase [Pseudohongiellaceae bacterium]